jgi:hypothetical protein
MLIQILAAASLLVLLWALFRLAMGLRWVKVSREQTRAGAESEGRRVVAEIPLPGELVFFTEDARGFSWAGRRVARSEISGARLLLNGGVIGAFSANGRSLPDPPAPEDYEGRERWDVVLYLADGRAESVPCGSLREGVSREIATRVFEAVRAATTGGATVQAALRER